MKQQKGIRFSATLENGENCKREEEAARLEVSTLA